MSRTKKMTSADYDKLAGQYMDWSNEAFADVIEMGRWLEKIGWSPTTPVPARKPKARKAR